MFGWSLRTSTPVRMQWVWNYMQLHPPKPPPPLKLLTGHTDHAFRNAAKIDQINTACNKVWILAPWGPFAIKIPIKAEGHLNLGVFYVYKYCLFFYRQTRHCGQKMSAGCECHGKGGGFPGLGHLCKLLSQNPPHGFLARSSSPHPIEYGLQSTKTLAEFQILIPPLTLLDVDITCEKNLQE